MHITVHEGGSIILSSEPSNTPDLTIEATESKNALHLRLTRITVPAFYY